MTLLSERVAVLERAHGNAGLASAQRRSQLDMLAAAMAVAGMSSAHTTFDVDTASQPPSSDGDMDVGKSYEGLPSIPQWTDDSSSSRERTSSIVQTALLFVAFVKKGLRTLAFCKYRKITEMVLRYALQDLHTSAPHLAPTVASYRGGYEREERREIEAGLFSGALTGVTATSALELGMDIGDLDITLHLGYPGTFSSYWQQVGRAGRTGGPSLSVMVCYDSPLDQYLAREPDCLFDSAPESVTVSIDNMYILRAHLPCAARERMLVLSRAAFESSSSSSQIPLVPSSLPTTTHCAGGFFPEGHVERPNQASVADLSDDRAIFGPTLVDAVKYLLSCGRLLIDEGISHHDSHYIYLKCPPALPHPQRHVSLRLIDPLSFTLIDVTSGPTARGGLKLDSIPYSRAFFELYEGAIYMHRAQQYFVTKLDLETLTALCKPVSVTYYTRANNANHVNIVKLFREVGVGESPTDRLPDDAPDSNTRSILPRNQVQVRMGAVQVSSTVSGYGKYSLSTGKLLELGSCSLPPLEYDTTAMWMDLPEHLVGHLRALGHEPSACTHAANHALVATAQLVVSCDQTDVACPHRSVHASGIESNRVLLFDTRPGGMGISEALFDGRRKMLQRAITFMATCPCLKGCLRCIYDHACPMRNNNLAKAGALLVLQTILQGVMSPMTATSHAVEKDMSTDHHPLHISRRDEATFVRDMSVARDKGMQLQQWTDSVALFQTESS